MRLLLVAVLTVVLGLPAAPAVSDGHVEQIVAFDPDAAEFPEGI